MFGGGKEAIGISEFGLVRIADIGVSGGCRFRGLQVRVR